MNIENIKEDYILGLDEAGTGAWVGPFYVGACLAKKDFFLKELKDSKKLSEPKRYNIFDNLLKNNKDIKIETISIDNNIIDSLGLGNALKKAYVELLSKFDLNNVYSILDGNLKIPNISLTIPKADNKYQQVMAASIAAKVSRDRYMIEISSQFPEFNWDKNKGYGSKSHVELIKKHGITKFHRRSYKPIAEINGKQCEQVKLF